MGKDSSDIEGLSIVCSPTGAIKEVLQDGLKATGRIGKNTMLTSLFPSSEFSKVLNFLAEINANGYSGVWHINSQLEGEIVTLNYIGSSLGEHILVVATASLTDLPAFFGWVMQRLPRHLEFTPSAVDNLSHSLQKGMQEGVNLLDELSRLNNELVNMQRELQKKNVELNRVNELKNRFLGIAAHDLRNPLSLVSGYNEILMEELRETLSEDHQLIFDTVHNSLDFMFNLIEDLLEYSVYESGNLEIYPSPQDIIGTIREVVALNQVLAQRKSIIIDFNPLPGPLILEYDSRRIIQALNNLLSNSIKFSHHHSTIWIEAMADENKCIISVKDEGTGLPEGMEDKLFVPFQKKGVSGTDGEMSTGLGLWIVHNIVTAHRGLVWFERNKGAGTIFRVSIPLKNTIA